MRKKSAYLMQKIFEVVWIAFKDLSAMISGNAAYAFIHIHSSGYGLKRNRYCAGGLNKKYLCTGAEKMKRSEGGSR